MIYLRTLWPPRNLFRLHCAAVRLICKPNSQQIDLCCDIRKKNLWVITSSMFISVIWVSSVLIELMSSLKSCLFRHFRGHHDIRANGFRQIGAVNGCSNGLRLLNQWCLWQAEDRVGANVCPPVANESWFCLKDKNGDAWSRQYGAQLWQWLGRQATKETLWALKPMKTAYFNHSVKYTPLVFQLWCFPMNDNYAEQIQILADKISLAGSMISPLISKSSALFCASDTLGTSSIQ